MACKPGRCGVHAQLRCLIIPGISFPPALQDTWKLHKWAVKGGNIPVKIFFYFFFFFSGLFLAKLWECWRCALLGVQESFPNEEVSRATQDLSCLLGFWLLRGATTILSSFRHLLLSVFSSWSVFSLSQGCPWELSSRESWAGICSWEMLPSSSTSQDHNPNILTRDQLNIHVKTQPKITWWGPSQPH